MRIQYRVFGITSKLIEHAPFWLLYGISDILRLVLFFIARYRKKVVFTNLRNAFPDKNKHEINQIAWEFYRNLSDIILETLKTNGLSKDELARRWTIKNPEVLQEYIRENRSIIVCTGHCGNWEWMGVHMSTYPEVNGYAVVKPLTDKYFENYVFKMRTRFKKDALIDFRSAFKDMIRMRNQFCTTAIVADQTPHVDEINYWTTFLNQDTPVFLGTEKIAKALDQPVIFMDMQRKRRGFYEATLIPVTKTPKETAEFEITEAHVRLLEKAIGEHPDNWLWSHRRWKHKRT